MSLYDALMADVTEKYPYFAARNLSSMDWSALVADDKTTADAAGTRDQFIAAAAPALARLRDVHVYWTTTGGAYVAGTHAEVINFSPVAAVVGPNAQVSINFATSWFQSFTSGSGALQGVYQSATRYQGSPFFVGGSIATGERTYAYIELYSLAFDDSVWGELRPRIVAATEQADGIIFDLRLNTGGNEAYAQRIGQLFAASTTPYTQVRYRDGTGFDSFGAWESISLGVASGCAYTAPVAVITSAACMSSCEAMALMFKELPQAKLIGQTTRGASGNPAPFKVSDALDLSLVYSRWQRADAQRNVLEGVGIRPDVEVPAPAGGVTPSSQAAWAQDTLDAALAHLDANADGTGKATACGAPSSGGTGGSITAVIAGAAGGGAGGLLVVVLAVLYCRYRRGRGKGGGGGQGIEQLTVTGEL